jgi:uncharacterized repeat protein (TIGR01451 family)
MEETLSESRRSHLRRRATRALPCAAAVGVAVALLVPASAAADRDYTIRFSRNAQGDITGTGNTLMTCVDTDSRCAAARQGQAGGADNNNNNLPMRRVDVDDDPTTFDSSAATLTLPAGAHVLFAGLYYGGRLQAGTDGLPAPDPNLRDRVLLRPPGGSYVALTAKQVDDAPVNPTIGAANRLYQGFVDVTDIVRTAGSGEYTVANVQLGTGLNADQAGGWALAVAYEDPSQTTRNLTIFDGFKFVSTDVAAALRPVDIPLQGFLTPPSGPVTTRIGLVALEGDLGTVDDSATINFGRPNQAVLTNATNPANNFFNSSISGRDATPFHGKRPDYSNQIGFDADVLDATGLLANGQTATTIRLNTNGDGYAPQVISFATDLFYPRLNITKAVDRVTARSGDVLTYTVDVSNIGLDAATNTTLRDVIPAGTAYVPNSMAIDGQPKTDVAGDDQAECVGCIVARRPVARTAGTVVMRLGTGANASTGGRLAIGATTRITFQVRVDAGLPSGYLIPNNALVSYIAETLQQPGGVTSPDVVTKVLVPDLAIEKSHSGDFVSGRTVTFTLQVTSVGDVATRGPVTVTDTLPAAMRFVQPPAPGAGGWACSTAGQTLTCTRSDELAPGAPIPPITYTARVAPGTPAGSLVNTARVSNAEDGNPNNDTDTVTGDNHPPTIDLAIDKVALTPVVFPGDPVRFVLRVQNISEDTATRVRVRDVLPPGLTLVSAVPDRGACRGTDIVVCRLGRMRPGATRTIEITAVAGADTGGRRLVDRARASARETDVNPDNNRDRAVVGVAPLVDIVVVKTAAAAQVQAGGDVTYTVVVRNDGPSNATGVALRDFVPVELQPVSATPTHGSCGTPTTCELGSIPAGGSVQVVVVARSDASLAGRTVTNAASAAAVEEDRDPANNFDSAPVTFVAPPPLPADVVVTKTAAARIVNVGETFTYTINAHNRGPGPAENVIVTDTPSASLTFEGASPSQGTCSSGAPLTCNLGTIAPGATATVVVTVRALAAGALANGVSAITSTPTTTPPPDRIDVAGVTVRSARPRVALRKRSSSRVVRSGGTVTWSLTATARGNGTAFRITVCDRLPRGFTVVSAGGARRHPDGRWCWTIGSLTAGATRTVRLVTRAPSVGTTLRRTNLATLAYADQAPRFASARIRVVPPNAPFTG